MKGMWLMDTGCGNDLVPARNVKGCHVESLGEDDYGHFQTTNGSVTNDQQTANKHGYGAET